MTIVKAVERPATSFTVTLLLAHNDFIPGSSLRHHVVSRSFPSLRITNAFQYLVLPFWVPGIRHLETRSSLSL